MDGHALDQAAWKENVAEGKANGRLIASLIPGVSFVIALEDAAMCAKSGDVACMLDAGQDLHPASNVLGKVIREAFDLSHGPTTSGMHSTKCPNGLKSFDGDTQVVMGDGGTKRIREIKVGDEVLAANPGSGEAGPREVTAVWVHKDEVVDLEVEGALLTTTIDHPFWNAGESSWQEAGQLDIGDQLLSINERRVTVGGLVPHSARTVAAFNLTVAGLHTYYVLAGSTPVLVHNDNGGPRVLWTGGDFPVGGAMDAGGPVNGILYRTHNGVTTSYAIYNSEGIIEYRVDLPPGGAHRGVPTPHYQPYKVNTNPVTGAKFPTPTGEAFNGYGPNGAPKVIC